MTFFRDDIARLPSRGAPPYDVIVCNGLLGGPVLHGVEDLTKAVTALSARLRAGGILLAADRFHGGWRKLTPGWMLMELFRKCGLIATAFGEGVAGEKPAR